MGRWEDREQGRVEQAGGGAANPPQMAALDGLAWLLDSAVPIPGTRMRIGLDAALGLIPVVGDLIGMALSSFILVQAARLGVPRVTLLRMGFNVTLEAVVGLVPFAGDVFDMAWKANKRNVDLLRAHLREPNRARRGDWLFAAGFLMFALALAGGLAWAGISIGRAIFG